MSPASFAAQQHIEPRARHANVCARAMFRECIFSMTLAALACTAACQSLRRAVTTCRAVTANAAGSDASGDGPPAKPSGGQAQGARGDADAAATGNDFEQPSAERRSPNNDASTTAATAATDGSSAGGSAAPVDTERSDAQAAPRGSQDNDGDTEGAPTSWQDFLQQWVGFHDLTLAQARKERSDEEKCDRAALFGSVSLNIMLMIILQHVAM